MDSMEKVIELNDPGHAKAKNINRLEKEITKHFMLMNDALVEGKDHIARFHDGIRFNLYCEWTKLKGGI